MLHGMKLSIARPAIYVCAALSAALWLFTLWETWWISAGAGAFAADLGRLTGQPEAEIRTQLDGFLLTRVNRLTVVPIVGLGVAFVLAAVAIGLRPVRMRFCEHAQVTRRGDLADQLHRAALSVSNNIAEGFELGTTPQLLSHLYIARGSAGEVRSMLCQMERIGRFEGLRSEISDLKLLSESCSRQLRAFADSLQNSEIKGARFLTDRAREEAEKRARREAFEAKLARVVDDARMKREAEAARAAGGAA